MSNLLDLVNAIRAKAPEYLDLLTARSEEEFENAFIALFEKGVAHLEKNKKNFEDLDEEALSAVLAASMTIPGLTVYQEAHSNGHVDLTFEADHCCPARTKLAEAKIYAGPAYHYKGLKQLLDRYMTGREGRGLLLVYCRKQDIEGLVKKLRARMDDEAPEHQQGHTTDHKLKWSFCSAHSHSSGSEVPVDHVGCNLFTEE